MKALRRPLRLYQRALRHEPQALPILRQVIEVAQQLDRLPEAMRYAQKAVELDPSDEIASAKLEDLRKALGKFEELVEMLLGRAEAAATAEARARAMAEIGRVYASELDDRAQAVVAYAQAFADDPKQAVAQVVFTTDGAKWVRVPPRVVRTGLELHPRNFLRDHRSMNAQL